MEMQQKLVREKMEKQKAMEASDARQMLRLVSCFVICQFYSLIFNIFSLNHFRIILESCATVPPDILSPGFLLLVCASKLCSFGARQEAQMKMFEATKAWSCNQGPAKAGTNESNERLEKHGRPPPH